MVAKVTVDDSKARAAYAKIKGNAPKELAKAAFNDLEDTMTISKEQTPVDTGTLRSTGTVDQPKISGNKVEIELGYGSQAAAYALEVHENLNASHTVGNSKYLEKPLLERNSGMANRMKSEIEKAFK